jgi:CMP-N,N'-diacetyllegionaminic acid synthase
VTRREILAIVPARGGSKGIPRKNVIPVGGRPLIAHSIEQARTSRLVTRTIVSTDDAEIADVARAHGAEVPFMRPAQYAQDLSLDIEVFRHALQWLADHEGYRPELVVHLRPTGPVRRVERIDQAIALMLEHPEADALRSVSAPIQTPYKMWRIEKNGYLNPLLTAEGVTEPYCMPRQSLPDVWWQNGYVDIIRPRTILELGLMCGRTVLPFVVDEPILEIDYEENVPAVEEALARLAAGEPDREVNHAKRFPV